MFHNGREREKEENKNLISRNYICYIMYLKVGFFSRSNNVARLNLLPRVYSRNDIDRVEYAIEKVNNIFNLKVYYNV